MSLRPTAHQAELELAPVKHLPSSPAEATAHFLRGLHEFARVSQPERRKAA